ncbi:MAG: DivIVA domain-containing protein [Actinobacteria bacterium]|nr:DivIVA domain-containing protein [Actinomycetota bacterium]
MAAVPTQLIAVTVTTSTTPDTPVVGGGSGAPLPGLASGVELFGEYEAGGFVEPKYLLRRADGQVVQLPWLLYLVACELDGRSDAHQVADRVSARAGREVSAANVTFLAEQRLAPLGVLEPRAGEVAPTPKGSHLFALGLRAALFPAGLVRAATKPFLALFHPAVVVGALVALAVLDGWLFLVRGFGTEVVEVLTDPVLFAALAGFQIFSGVFHELGHSTACRYGGASPGKVGVGIYLVWPVYYSDVTDSYRLSRLGRLRTDLGGVYFNVVLVLVLAGAYLATGWEPLLVAIVLEQFDIVYQFLPFLRLDGYYVVSDLIGVPDLFGRIGPILRSLRPGAPPDPAVTELKPRVRPIVTIWVLASVVVIAGFLGAVVTQGPSWVATASSIFGERIDEASASMAEGDLLGAAYSALRASLSFIPVIGITWTVARIVLRRRRKALARVRHGAGVQAAAPSQPDTARPGAKPGRAVVLARGKDGRPKRVGLTPEQLQEFPLKVRWRGYDQKQVRALLGAVARRYSASAGGPGAQPAVGAGGQGDDLLESVVATELLREAADHAERVRQEAEDQAFAQIDIARRIYEEAAAEAAAMRARADHEAADLVGAARRQLDAAFELKLRARRELGEDDQVAVATGSSADLGADPRATPPARRS